MDLTIEKGSVGGERAKGKPTDALKMTVEGYILLVTRIKGLCRRE